MQEIILFSTTEDVELDSYYAILIQNAHTVRNKAFLKAMQHNCKYSESEGRIMSLGVTLNDGVPVSIASVKSQKRKRGVWGRYATITYAYTDRRWRRQGMSKELCHILVDESHADRVKALASSLYGLELHRSLNHDLWGLSDDGKVIIDSRHEGPELQGMPPQVKQFGGSGLISYHEVLPIFKQFNLSNYSGRLDPEEQLLDGFPDGNGYVMVDATELLELKAGAGESVRWAGRRGVLTKRLTARDLNVPGLCCFKDVNQSWPCYYIGYVGGELTHRVYVSKRGEVRQTLAE